MEQLTEYSKTEYPFNLSILYNALKRKLQTDPKYEVWVPFVHIRLQTHLKNKTTISEYRPHKIFVSNLGRILSLKKTIPVIVPQHIASGYPRVTIQVSKNKAECFRVHRVIACSFLSLDKFLLSHENVEFAHPKELQVNHIDGIKNNLELENLEWVTAKGNFDHAVITGLYVPASGPNRSGTRGIKGRVVNGKNKGTEFILFGSKQMKELGFDKANLLRSVKLGNGVTHKNCVWSFATKKEIETLPHLIDRTIAL